MYLGILFLYFRTKTFLENLQKDFKKHKMDLLEQRREIENNICEVDKNLQWVQKELTENY